MTKIRLLFQRFLLGAVTLFLALPLEASTEVSAETNSSKNWYEFANITKPPVAVITVKGKVVDSNNEPLIAVNILVKGTTNGTSSDINGEFELRNVNVEDILVVSYIGYETVELPVNGQTEILISLQEDTKALDEVVVVGYGTQLKRNLTGAVESITSEDLGNQSITSAANALQGRVSGVQIIQGSAQPGKDNPTIQIRGVGTVRTSIDEQNNDSSPLVLVDGVQSTLNDVHPNDIESFTVLKDAASAAIYGARAANGVILVTTKRGNSGKPKITYNFYTALQTPTATPQMLSPYEFALLKNEAQTNTGRPVLYSDQELQYFQDGSNPNYSTRGFFEDGYVKNAPLQNHYLSITGGSDHVKYMISAGYQDQEGVVIETNSKRINFRSNLDITISDKITGGMNFAGSFLNSNEPNFGGFGVTQLIRDMIRKAPLNPYQYENGYISSGNITLSGRTDGGIHPIGLARFGGQNETRTYRITPNLYLGYEPVKNLRFRVNGSIFVENDKQNLEQRKMTVSNGQDIFQVNGMGGYEERDALETTSTLEATGNYQFDLGKSNFQLLAGMTSQSFRRDFFSASNEGHSGKLTELDAASLNPSVSGNASEWALNSFFGRIAYNFNSKYLAEFNIRHDGSSRFGRNNRYGTFPSVSIGWNLEQENFMQSVSQIDKLKLRTSWGQLGNQNIGNYPSIATVNLDQPYVFGNALVSGAATLALANSNIKWETTENLDFGLDATFFEYKFSLTADYYIRTSKNVLLRPPIVATLGNLTPPFVNKGKVENRGYEFSVNYFGNIGNEFEFSLSANWSHNDNKVLEIDSEFLSANKVLTRVGLPINSFFGHRIIGIFQSDAEAQNAEKYGVQPGQTLTAAGDFIYEDTNEDGTVDADDRVIVGNPNIRNTYGFTLNAEYKNFNFRALFQGVLGRDIEYGVYGTDGLRGLNNLTKEFLNRWTPENPNTDVPRVATGYRFNNSLFVGPILSSRIYDASYLRMKHIELGYTLPLDMVSSIGFSSIRFYLSGQNLLTFTDFVDGYDPEDAATFNNVNDSYPQAKTISFGINLSL